MEVYLLELVRCSAAVAGAVSFLSLNKSQSWRSALATITPGCAAGIFLAPLICENVQILAVPWLKCGNPHAECGVAVVVGFLGHASATVLLSAAPEWLRKRLGVQEEPPPPPGPARRPDSDPKPAV